MTIRKNRYGNHKQMIGFNNFAKRKRRMLIKKSLKDHSLNALV
jgi:hypothetical protein